MTLKGRQFISVILGIESKRLAWLRTHHVEQVLEMLDGLLKEYRGDDGMSAGERLRLGTYFKEVRVVDEQIAHIHAAGEPATTPRGVVQERKMIKGQIRTYFQNHPTALNHTIENLYDLLQRQELSEITPPSEQVESQKSPEERQAAARQNMRMLFMGMTHGDQRMCAALEAHFLDTQHPPSVHQQRLLKIPFRQLREHFYRELESAKRQRLHEMPPAPAIGIYSALLGRPADDKAPRSRAEHTAGEATLGYADNVTDDIYLWQMFEWQFMPRKTLTHHEPFD